MYSIKLSFILGERMTQREEAKHGAWCRIIGNYIFNCKLTFLFTNDY